MSDPQLTFVHVMAVARSSCGSALRYVVYFRFMSDVIFADNWP